jgi:hypothetical protein
MRRLFEPHETLEGRLDPGEILFGQGGGNMAASWLSAAM